MADTESITPAPTAASKAAPAVETVPRAEFEALKAEHYKLAAEVGALFNRTHDFNTRNAHKL